MLNLATRKSYFCFRSSKMVKGLMVTHFAHPSIVHNVCRMNAWMDGYKEGRKRRKKGKKERRKINGWLDRQGGTSNQVI